MKTKTIKTDLTEKQVLEAINHFKQIKRKNKMKKLTTKKTNTMKTKTKSKGNWNKNFSSLLENINKTPLNTSEIKIVSLMSKGKSRTEIGTKLNIIPSTLWVQVKKIHSKLNVDSDTKAVSVARRKRIIL